MEKCHNLYLFVLHSAIFSSAFEWQGHSKQMCPISVEVEKRRLQVFDRSGSTHRSLNLGNQDCLDVLLANDRQNKALLLKVPKEYDLVSRGWIPQPHIQTKRNSTFCNKDKAKFQTLSASLSYIASLMLCFSFQVLFFEEESKRADFIKYLCLELKEIRQEIRVKELREKELLKEALTKEQRAQIVETFIRHAFSKVQSNLCVFTSCSALLKLEQLYSKPHGVVSSCLRC